jgi:hypothetical protein
LLTQPRSPTTTGKIERFHRTLRLEFDTTRVFANLAEAQAALEGWVAHYNAERTHQSLNDETPASRFGANSRSPRPAVALPAPAERSGEQWVARKVGANGVVSVGWQQVSVGKHHSGDRCDVLVSPELLQFWVDNQLLKTVARNGSGQIRKKHAAGTGRRT